MTLILEKPPSIKFMASDRGKCGLNRNSRSLFRHPRLFLNKCPPAIHKLAHLIKSPSTAKVTILSWLRHLLHLLYLRCRLQALPYPRPDPGLPACLPVRQGGVNEGGWLCSRFGWHGYDYIRIKSLSASWNVLRDGEFYPARRNPKP